MPNNQMVRQYVGARYVPKFADPVAWSQGTSYEALTIVTYNNSSYTSKKPVPANIGNPANNPEYWALTGNYNAQVEQYREEVEGVKTDFNNSFDKFKKDINQQIKDITTDLTNTLEPIQNDIDELNIPKRIIPGGATIGHRGCSFAPENTVQSYVAGLTMGYDGVEGDLNYTADNILVMMHDNTIQTYTNDGTGNIRSLSYSAIKDFNYNKGFTESYRGDLCTFEEFLGIAKTNGSYAEVDIAERGLPNAIIDKAINMVVNRGMINKVIFACDKNNYKYVLSKNKYLNITVSMSGVSEADVYTINDEIKKLTNRYILSFPIGEFKQKYLEDNLPVKLWTVDTESELIKYYNAGVMEILVNFVRSPYRTGPWSLTPYNNRLKNVDLVCSGSHGLMIMTGGATTNTQLTMAGFPGLSMFDTHFSKDGGIYCRGYMVDRINGNMYPLAYDSSTKHINAIHTTGTIAANTDVSFTLFFVMDYHYNIPGTK